MERNVGRLRGALVLAVAVTAASDGRLSAQPDSAVPLRGILTRAAAYVDRFEHEFALVVSDERYDQKQTIYVGSQQRDRQVSRQTQSEMAFVWLPHERLWLTARSVLAVDGIALRGAERAASALANPDRRDIALRRMRDDSARFNLGEVYRNFNEPTFALQFLSASLRPRFSWRVDGRERLDGVDTYRIGFTERRRPTIVQRPPDGRDMPTRGFVWIEARSGAVFKTQFEIRDTDRRTHAVVRVVFGTDPRIPVRVPIRMEEEYTQERKTGTVGPGPQWTVGEIINTAADYSHFRRFETSGRLIESPQ